MAEPLKTAKGLWSMLYKGDHPEFSGHESRSDFPDALGVPRDSPSLSTLSQLSLTPGLQDIGSISPDIPLHAISEIASLQSPVAALPSEVAGGAPVAANRSSFSGMHAGAPSERQVLGDRHRDIRASFHLDLAAVESAHVNLLRFQNTNEMEKRSEAVFPEVQALLAKFEHSGIAARPARSQTLDTPAPEGLTMPDNALLKAIIADDDPSLEIADGSIIASSTEISTCTAQLNFYRWLCGLPMVQLCSGRLAVCNLVSVCLLAYSGNKSRLGPEGKAFTEALIELISANGGRLSVLQGEASLIAAVEQSISSTHMVSVPAGLTTVKAANRTELARQLAAEVQSGPSEPMQISPRRRSISKETKKAKGQQSQGVARRFSSEAPTTFGSASELPEPLCPMRVLWELKGESCEPADPAAQRASMKARPTIKGERKAKDELDPGGLSAIWGDRDGAFSLRRCLLSPALREFGVARRNDTCVLWTSADKEMVKVVNKDTSQQSVEKGKRSGTKGIAGSSPRKARQASLQLPSTDADSVSIGAGSIESVTRRQSKREAEAPGAAAVALGAVCWPPAGFVPLTLLEFGSVAWTIMPDGARYQPTASTRIRMWRVQIDRPPGGMWTAERKDEVTVRGFAVDCSSQGEPFCVVFWPDLPKFAHGAQFEVVLDGLRGASTSLAFFYEFRAYLQQAINESLVKEAVGFANSLGERCLWREPRDPEVEDKSLESQKKSNGRLSLFVKPAPLIELVSYHEKAFTTNSVDVTIVIQSGEVATIQAQLNLLRFGGEEEMIPCGTQVQRLGGSQHFVLRAKLPMSRCRFELRLFASSSTSPQEMTEHPLKYLITTGSSCQTLLSSMEDPKWKKFGLAPVQPVAQVYGAVLISPVTRRIVIGQNYFLVYIDKQRALEAAAAEVQKVRDHVEKAEQGSKRSSVQAAKSSQSRLQSKMLFSKRLLGEDGFNPRGSTVSLGATFGDFGGAGFSDMGGSKVRDNVTMGELQKHLRRVLEPRTQDSVAEIHFDIALRSGEVLHRLRERPDFPGLFEGVFNFESSDACSLVRLFIRFPQLHAFEYAPRKLVEWYVCRNEHFPINF